MFKLFELSPVTLSLVLENHNAKRTQNKQVMDMPHLDSLCCTSVPLFKSRVLLYCHSVAKLCLTLCDPMDSSTSGFLVFHYLLQFAQTLVHWVGDDIQPSHPVSSLSPLALNLSSHQGLFQWVGSVHLVVKGLEFQHLYHWIRSLLSSRWYVMVIEEALETDYRVPCSNAICDGIIKSIHVEISKYKEFSTNGSLLNLLNRYLFNVW